MSNFKDSIKAQLLQNRPALSPSSLKTYSALLNSLANKMGAQEKKLSFFSEDPTEVIKYIDHNVASDHSKKTILSSLFILTGVKDYQAKMHVVLDLVAQHYQTQELSASQAKYRITFAQVVKKVAEAKAALKLSKSINNYQNYLIACLTSGVYLPPRRLEIASIKIRNIDEAKDNFLRPKTNVIVFNHFKTAHVYGSQSITVPLEIQRTMKAYLLLNDNEYLFYNTTTGKRFENNKFTQRLNLIYGPGISVSALRSIYLSELNKDAPYESEMEATARQMGHSVSVARNMYIKKDGKKETVV